MFSFFKKKPSPVAPSASIAPTAPVAANPAASAPAVQVAPPVFPATGGSLIGSALVKPLDIAKVLEASAASPERERWLAKLTSGLRKTGSSISAVFNGTQINDALYEDLESALLMADTGVKATAGSRWRIRCPPCSMVRAKWSAPSMASASGPVMPRWKKS